MKERRELEFKVWNLSEEDILNKSLFDLLGKETVIERFKGAYLNLNRTEVGAEKRFDIFYLNKIGNRKVVNYISTLREINGQVGTRLYKLEHNAFITGLLREADIIDGIYFSALYPNFMKKMLISAELHLGLVPVEGEVGDGKSHLIYVLNDGCGVTTGEESKDFEIPMGHWEGGREKITKLKRRKGLIDAGKFNESRKAYNDAMLGSKFKTQS